MNILLFHCNVLSKEKCLRHLECKLSNLYVDNSCIDDVI